MADLDSRLVSPMRKRKQALGVNGLFVDRVYCVGCGIPYGGALVSTEGIIYVCDECVAKHGEPPLPKITEIDPTPRKEG